MVKVTQVPEEPNLMMHRYRSKSIFQQVLLFLLLAVTLTLSIGCNSNSPSERIGQDGKPLQSVALMLNWYPEAEHGGFYAAQVHGIFQQYGLDVQILAGGPSAPVAQELLTGRVQFAVGNADDVLLFRQEQADIVALMAPIQNTPRCVLVHADSQVKDLSQLSGLTLQANVGRPFLNFMEHKGLLKDVKVVPFSGNVANFVTDPQTAIQAYSFSEPLLAKQQGVETRALMLSDIGFNPYASCLIATGDYLRDNEDLVRRMVIACQLGWQKYLAEPDQTNALILTLNSQGMSAEALKFGAQQIRPLCLPDGMNPEMVGQMQESRWKTLADQFIELGLAAPDRIEPSKVFTTRYLQMKSQPQDSVKN
jgi:NitT/TauT family transport system substrate-binding protein